MLTATHGLARLTQCFQVSFLGLILFFASSVLSGAQAPYALVSDKAKFPILSPSLAEQKTKKIRLANGLEAYLISDPNAELSGAMLSVKAGSWDDPIEHPGLAHFLEHMLFLGTVQYPEESEYERFITEHGGQTNAFTMNSSTNYLFSVSTPSFPEAISRFSSFFKAPLFNPSGVSREINAIDQEFAKNREQNNARQLYVLKALANPSHPFHNFNMGHSESLAKANKEKLQDWFQTHYSSNLMKLVVYSSLSLENLTELVVKEFSPIRNKGRASTVIEIPAFLPSKPKKYVFIEPIKDSRTLSLVWELPRRFSHMKQSQPGSVVAYILGHEGEKSLLAQLKRENLAEALACGQTKLGDDFSLFYLQIELTEAGLADIDQVITRCFQAINHLQKQETPYYIFEEIQQLATIEYQYQSKEDEFSKLMEHAFQIQDENLETYPEHSKIIQQYQPDDIRDLLVQLNPQNALFLIMAPSRLTGITPKETEKWLGVNYVTKKIPEDHLAKWVHAPPHAEIDFPAPNVFIPENLHIIADPNDHSAQIIPQPRIVEDNESMRVYFAYDTTFRMPKISWTITILTPQVTINAAQKIVFADLFVKDLKDRLDKISYPARLGGLNYDICRAKNGIKLTIQGYSQNANRLLKEVLDGIKNYRPTMAKFKVLKDSLMRKYKNFKKEPPIDQATDVFMSILYEGYVTEPEKAAALRKASFKKYTGYIDQLFKSTYIESLLYGNMNEEQAKSAVALLKDTFQSNAYLKEEHINPSVVILPDGEGPYFLECRTKAQGNAALLAIEKAAFSFKERAAQQILMQAIKEPFFHALRTRQQTGYLVQSFPEEIERKLFNFFVVQSNTHDARDLLSRFEELIETNMQEWGKTELLKNQFENIKATLYAKYRQPAKNIAKMGELLNTLAFDYEGDFEWIEKRLKGFEELNYDEFLSFSKKFLGRTNKRRLAILMQGVIPKENKFAYKRASSADMIRRFSKYEAITEQN